MYWYLKTCFYILLYYCRVLFIMSFIMTQYVKNFVDIESIQYFLDTSKNVCLLVLLEYNAPTKSAKHLMTV